MLAYESYDLEGQERNQRRMELTGAVHVTGAGGVLFGLAYTAALFLRDSTYNSTKVLQPYLPTLDVTLNGNFAIGASLVVVGAFLGYVNSLE